MTGTLVLEYYIQACVVNNTTVCVCPGNPCSKETDCQIRRVQLGTGIVRFQIVMLPGSAVNQEGMTL